MGRNLAAPRMPVVQAPPAHPRRLDKGRRSASRLRGPSRGHKPTSLRPMSHRLPAPTRPISPTSRRGVWNAISTRCHPRPRSSAPTWPTPVDAVAPGGRDRAGPSHRQQPLDTRHAASGETLRGIGRTHGEAPRRSAALTTSDIKQLLAVCGDDMAGVRDKALFLVCFAGAVRRSELVGLDVEHVTWTTKGLTLLITRSKTDKESAGAEIGIPFGGAPETCPVKALRLWLDQAESVSRPMFRKVDRWGAVHGGRLDPDAVRQVLRKRTGAAGMTGPSGSQSRHTAGVPVPSRRPTGMAFRTKRSWATSGIEAWPRGAATCAGPSSTR